MGKYLMHWRLNSSLIPIDPQERGQGFAALMEFVQQDIEVGLTKDWGCYVGEGRGYCIVEGSEVEIAKMVQQYNPYCEFSTHPVASVDQIIEMIRSI
ncbi:MAG: hypothetical protein KAQ72_10510 [Desulfobacula sp.]|nr:hypothetical protein [Desulfobacula sp.]